ncbi:MAG: thiamine-phosphate kinase, partial [Gammaproteobacteria bacterium]
AGAMADSGVAGLRRDAPADALEALRQRFLFPTPRIAEGEALRGLASACIDISDGLVGDLGKLAAASACAAVLDVDALPRSAALAAGFAPEAALRLICDGGDDYELLLAVPPAHIARVAAMPGLTRIGELREASTAARVTLRRRAADGTLSETPAVQAGFDHFAG